MIKHMPCYLAKTHFRMVIRIMVMVPLYAISSFVSLFSLEAAVIIDVVRDVYEVSLVSWQQET
jgi:hypothetical protein